MECYWLSSHNIIARVEILSRHFFSENSSAVDFLDQCLFETGSSLLMLKTIQYDSSDESFSQLHQGNFFHHDKRIRPESLISFDDRIRTSRFTFTVSGPYCSMYFPPILIGKKAETKN